MAIRNNILNFSKNIPPHFKFQTLFFPLLTKERVGVRLKSEREGGDF
jgi:hypothetical protein